MTPEMPAQGQNVAYANTVTDEEREAEAARKPGARPAPRRTDTQAHQGR